MDTGNEIVVKSGGIDPVVVVVCFFAVIIVGGFIWGLYMMYKQKSAGSETGATETKQPQKSSRNEGRETDKLQDTRWLVRKVEDIEDGIVVTDGGRRFVAAITCRGVDLYNAGVGEQLSVMRGYQKFYNIMEKPMSYRQYCKAIDLDIPKSHYTTRYEETLREYEHYVGEFQNAKEHRASEEVLNRLAELVNRHERKIRRLEGEIKNIEFYSESDVSMEGTQNYIFDWTYSPGISEVKLSKTEIFLRARQELTAIAQQKIDALLASGVKARMCTQDEMMDMFRHHSKPIGSEIYKQKMLRESSFEEDIVTSNSIKEATEALYKEDMEILMSSLFVKEDYNES